MDSLASKDVATEQVSREAKPDRMSGKTYVDPEEAGLNFVSRRLAHHSLKSPGLRHLSLTSRRLALHQLESRGLAHSLQLNAIHRILYTSPEVFYTASQNTRLTQSSLHFRSLTNTRKHSQRDETIRNNSSLIHFTLHSPALSLHQTHTIAERKNIETKSRNVQFFFRHDRHNFYPKSKWNFTKAIEKIKKTSGMVRTFRKAALSDSQLYSYLLDAAVMDTNKQLKEYQKPKPEISNGTQSKRQHSPSKHRKNACTGTTTTKRSTNPLKVAVKQTKRKNISLATELEKIDKTLSTAVADKLFLTKPRKRPASPTLLRDKTQSDHPKRGRTENDDKYTNPRPHKIRIAHSANKEAVKLTKISEETVRAKASTRQTSVQSNSLNLKNWTQKEIRVKNPFVIITKMKDNDSFCEIFKNSDIEGIFDDEKAFNEDFLLLSSDEEALNEGKRKHNLTLSNSSTSKPKKFHKDDNRSSSSGFQLNASDLGHSTLISPTQLNLDQGRKHEASKTKAQKTHSKSLTPPPVQQQAANAALRSRSTSLILNKQTRRERFAPYQSQFIKQTATSKMANILPYKVAFRFEAYPTRVMKENDKKIIIQAISDQLNYLESLLKEKGLELPQISFPSTSVKHGMLIIGCGLDTYKFLKRTFGDFDWGELRIDSVICCDLGDAPIVPTFALTFPATDARKWDDVLYVIRNKMKHAEADKWIIANDYVMQRNDGRPDLQRYTLLIDDPNFRERFLSKERYEEKFFFSPTGMPWTLRYLAREDEQEIPTVTEDEDTIKARENASFSLAKRTQEKNLQALLEDYQLKPFGKESGATKNNN